MARPVTPLMSLMTLASCTCLAVRAFCLCGMQVAAALDEAVALAHVGPSYPEVIGGTELPC